MCAWRPDYLERCFCVLVAYFCAVCAGALWVTCEANQLSPKGNRLLGLELQRQRSHIYVNWACPEDELKAHFAVNVVRQHAGDVPWLKSWDSSNNVQFDVKCLEAVCESTFDEPKYGGAFLMFFTSSRPFAYKLARDAFSKQGISMFRVPVSVLKKYPGAFSKKELLDSSNEVVVWGADKATLNDSDVQRIRHVYVQWNEFFKANRHLTKAKIWAESDKIFGDSIQHPLSADTVFSGK